MKSLFSFLIYPAAYRETILRADCGIFPPVNFIFRLYPTFPVHEEKEIERDAPRGRGRVTALKIENCARFSAADAAGPAISRYVIFASAYARFLISSVRENVCVCVCVCIQKYIEFKECNVLS